MASKCIQESCKGFQIYVLRQSQLSPTVPDLKHLFRAAHLWVIHPCKLRLDDCRRCCAHLSQLK